MRNIFGWLLLTISIFTAISTILLIFGECQKSLFDSGDQFAELLATFTLIPSGLVFAVIGRIMTLYRPKNRIGWLISFLGILLPLSTGLGEYTHCALYTSVSLPYAGLAAWLNQLLGTAMVILIFCLLPALFPEGTFLSNWWKLVVGSAVTLTLVLTTLSAVAPGPMTMNGMLGEIPLDNPIGLPFPWLRNLENFLYYGIPFSAILASLLGIAAFITRFRRSSGGERQQLKWFAYFLTLVVTVHIVGFELLGGFFYPSIFEHWSYGIILILSFSGFPIVIALAIFRYRLYDIDILIRRTVLYSLVTGALVLIYFGLVTLLQNLLVGITGQQSSLAVVISTLAIAALFNPLRTRLQEFIDIRFYRRRYDAEQTLEKFAETARNETDLQLLTSRLALVVSETMQPEKVSLWLGEQDG